LEDPKEDKLKLHPASDASTIPVITSAKAFFIVFDFSIKFPIPITMLSVMYSR